MSDIITKVDYSGDGITAVNAQDVEGIQRNCYEQRDASIAGRTGLGYLAADIPMIEILNARNNGIDLYEKEVRDKWLLSHPQYICHVNTGKTGKIIIK